MLPTLCSASLLKDGTVLQVGAISSNLEQSESDVDDEHEILCEGTISNRVFVALRYFFEPLIHFSCVII